MKSVIVDIKKNSAAFLQDNGVVVKKKDENYSIGDVVIMKDRTIRKTGKLKFATVAALFLILIGAGTVAYASPYYYVSMDVNPSILMKVNIFQRVIGIEAVNEDAAQIIADLKVKNMGVDDAVCVAVQQLQQAGYLAEDKGEILLSTACGNESNSEKLALKVQLAAQGELTKNQLQNQVCSQTCTKDMVKQAAQLGLSHGKLNLIQNMLGEEVGNNAGESVQALMSRYQTQQANGECDGTGDCDQTQDQTMQQDQTRAQDGTGEDCDGTGDCDQSGSDSTNGSGNTDNGNGKN